MQYNTQITQNTLLKMRQLFTRQNTSSFYSFLSCILTCVIYYNEKISSVLGNILAVLWWLMRNRELWSVLVFTCLHAKHIKNCLLKNDCLSVCFIKKWFVFHCDKYRLSFDTTIARIKLLIIMKYVKQTVHIICQMGTNLQRQSPQYIKIK